MSRYNELEKIKELQKEKIKEIVIKELALTNVEKEIYLRNLKSEDWGKIKKELNVSIKGIENTLGRIRYRYKNWVKNEEEKNKKNN